MKTPTLLTLTALLVSSAANAAQPTSIFDGKTLDGWARYNVYIGVYLYGLRMNVAWTWEGSRKELQGDPRPLRTGFAGGWTGFAMVSQPCRACFGVRVWAVWAAVG